jgi:signal transduction histidine kinase
MELILKNQQINQLNETLEQEVASRTQALQNTLDKLEVNAKELEISLEKEKVLGDLKTRFVSMASHEFRTPLTSILGSATLIETYQSYKIVCKSFNGDFRGVFIGRKIRGW